jgi:predicted O-linked N-acetylglucosamine transferase (SPINDLY family)
LPLLHAGRYAELELRLSAFLAKHAQDAFGWGLLGTALQLQGKDGIPALRKALGLDPQSYDVLNSLGVALRERGMLAEATECFRRAVNLQPSSIVSQFNFGDTLRMLGRFAEAESVLRVLLQQNPALVDAMVSLADALIGQGHLAEAEALTRDALLRAPDSALAHFCLGNVLRSASRLDEARASFERAVIAAPQFAAAHDNLGSVLQQLNQVVPAERAHREAIRLAPGDVNAYINLGGLHADANRFAEAENCYANASLLDPGNLKILDRLAHALRELGRPGEARACYEKILAIDPARLTARLGSAVLELPLVTSSVEEANAVVARFVAALDVIDALPHDCAAPRIQQEDIAGISLPFLLAYRKGNHRSALSQYGDLLARCLEPDVPPFVPARKKTRLLIITQHVRRHSVWDIVLRGLLVHIDREQFEIVLYHLDAKEDDETAFAKTLVDIWRDRQSISTVDGWLSSAKADQPDVILYPELGMSSITACLAAHRLAPLQVAGWGHPVTSGLATIDCFFSGELLEPEGADAHYREKLVRLPGTGCCTERPQVEAEKSPEIEALLAERHGPRFVIAQRSIKLDPSDDAVFARLAKRVGDCTFFVFRDPIAPWATELVIKRLRRAFAAEGVSVSSRLVQLPWLSEAEFLSFLDQCDVFLDCPNFSGYTTAWQALNSGLPIVTLEGECLRQRLAAGLLRQVGLPETIAQSPDEYILIAERLARDCIDSDRRNELRERIRGVASCADGNIRVVRAFEDVVLKELSRVRGVPVPD